MRDARVVSAAFVPTGFPRGDGTIVSSAELFEREVLAWLPTAAPGYASRRKDAKPDDATFEVPLEWRFEK